MLFLISLFLAMVEEMEQTTAVVNKTYDDYEYVRIVN